MASQIMTKSKIFDKELFDITSVYKFDKVDFLIMPKFSPQKQEARKLKIKVQVPTKAIFDIPDDDEPTYPDLEEPPMANPTTRPQREIKKPQLLDAEESWIP